MTPVYPSGRYLITVNQEHFTLSDGTKLTVPAGFAFDGHSIPPPLSAFLNPLSADVRAALLHDYLYFLHEHKQTNFTRSQVDYEYLLEMQRCGTNMVRRYTFYIAVRLWGWIWWYF